MSSSEPTQQLSSSSSPASQSALAGPSRKVVARGEEDDAYFSQKINVPSVGETVVSNY